MVKDPCLTEQSVWQGAQVQSMVWELRSHMLCDEVKKKKKKRALIKLRWLRACRVVSLGGTGAVGTVGLVSMGSVCVRLCGYRALSVRALSIHGFGHPGQGLP